MFEITAFIGLSKNVGKTTFLNRYIEKKDNYIITSIGWDGEAVDHIFGIKKPSILVKKDNFVCTYSKLKPTKSIKILELPIENQFLGQLEVYKMLDNDIVQIAGPSSTKQFQTFLQKTTKELKNIKEIIIDGAADRRISLSFANEIFFIIGPTFSTNPQKIIDTIIGIVEMFEIPIFNKETIMNKEINLLSSLNKSNINNLQQSQVYVLENLGKIIIDYESIPKIMKEYKIFVKNKPHKYSIVVNSFNAELMKNTLDTKNIKKEIKILYPKLNIIEI
ncbi:MAG: hypothetical protein RMJ36_02500 [Candidatus Calescibacterium sp.]|nr:hypothetical protein [Candidatus Calescibacterium sp.]MDW8132509.1 hypothetical protein [Candidatus Calescibacterium sp.]